MQVNKQLIQQLNELHESDNHDKIIQTIEEFSKSELNYELKNLLGRAYNNISEYQKALEILLSESVNGLDDALWNFRVGYAYYYNNEPGKALPYFQKSSALGDTTAKDFEKWCIEEINQDAQQIIQTKSKMTLNNIAWSFSSKFYTDSEEFNQKVINYQKGIYTTDEQWKPNEIVFELPELQIQYMAWITKPTDLLENERLIEDDENTFEEYPDEDQHQVEIIAKLKADNGKNFTALEFLMKAHNQQTNKKLGDHVFFEGTDEEPEMIDNLPTCFISCGS
ncbi:hypothetical protein AAG747_04740 [Rapidithrix thailandica]|uniref:Tetratricopeptide repeat protein n=1 Tax=Rapidithrix thailandica TaxID=413964 RepID=A0AAW9RU94_9BACT